jgi:hypothetical protein
VSAWIKVRRGEPERFDRLRRAAYITVEGERSKRSTTCYRCRCALPKGDGFAVTILCRGAYRGATKYLCSLCVDFALEIGVAGDSMSRRMVGAPK